MSPVIIDFKQNLKAARKVRLPQWAVLSWTMGCLPIIWLLDQSGRLNLALPVLNCIGMLGFLIVVKWNLRGYAWFWITMIVMAALHVPLILYIPWTTRWVPALAIAVIDSVDFCLILAILSVVGNFMEGANPAGG
jgi:hypothetical protein